MVKTSKWRGHQIECINDLWVYYDTKQKVSENKDRSCGHCGKPQTKEGHDGCLGTLHNVMNACCGHGTEAETYVQFWDNEVIQGEEAAKYIRGSNE